MHQEHHYSTRSNWIRAAVLGANDGIISMSGLVMGLASSGIEKQSITVGALSALAAGALSMWAGEYVSVSSQADSEKQDVLIEKKSLEEKPEEEFEELIQAYIDKGISPALAKQVATELTEKDALKAHLHEELNYDDDFKARPWEAAFVSFFSFIFGGALPTLIGMFAENIMMWIYPATLVSLAFLGYFSARLGGVKPLKPILRITVLAVVVLIITDLLGGLYS